MKRAERDFPTGTVTFLFSDIEGSTRLAQTLGTAGYRDVLERHQTLMRTAFDRNGGIERGTEGDSFFVVFEDAHDAVAAAVAAQRGLGDEQWAPGAVVRVRIGLHTGAGVAGGDDYVGIDVNRAARIAAAAHGGQVLMSDAVRALAERSLPDGVALRDLGVHRLKDLDVPERLFQLVVDGLRSDFPPPRAMDVGGAANLPPRLTTFVDREDERRELTGLIGRGRLVTITGPGGTGKTSLSLAVAYEIAEGYRDGAWFVALESIRDPDLLPAAIVRALHLDVEDPRPPLARLVDFLRNRELLLVLDNFEHLLPAATVVRTLLTEARAIRVLAASQAPLHVTGEQELPLEPLPVPVLPAVPSTAELDSGAVDNPSVHLFVDRARAVRPEFELDSSNLASVVAICARLQGVPLAIELAAAQVRFLSPAAILGRLSTRIDALVSRQGDAPERQRTLEAAVRWSYELLDPQAQALLRWLSTFAGGAGLDEIEQATAGVASIGDPFETLSTLVDRSLMRPVAPGSDRYTMLETIRSFAANQLTEAGEASGAHRRHAEVFAGLAARAEAELHRSSRRRWLERITLDHDNIRAALDRMEEGGELELALRMAASLWRFWQQTGHLDEAQPRLERLLAKAEGSPVGLPAALLSRAEEAAGGVGYWRRTRDAGAIERHYRRSLDLARTTGDPRPIAWGLYNLSFAYDFVPLSVSMADDSARARQLRLEALAAFRELDDSRGMAYALWGLGSPLSAELSVDQMRTYLREAVDRFRDADDAFGESWALISTGMLEATHGGLDEALPPIVAGGRLFDRDGDVSGQLVLIDALASLLSRAGDHRGAVRLDAASVAFRGRTGAAAPPIPLFRGPIATSREVLDGETIGAQERLAEGIDFPSILAAAARAADRGITALEREIEQLGRSTPDTSAALAGIDAT